MSGRTTKPVASPVAQLLGNLPGVPSKPSLESKGPRPRTRSRMAAVQALYQMDLAGTDVTAVIEDFIQTRFVAAIPEEGGHTDADTQDVQDTLIGSDAQFFAELLRGVVRRQRDIDPLVDDQLVEGWRLARVDSIMRAILRSGTFELMERSDVPGRVIINEYVDVAKAFFNDDEPKVVNGVLDRLARRLRPEEFKGRV
jgi:transcription antitermination protein NusB